MDRKLNGWCEHGVPGGIGCAECARLSAVEAEQTAQNSAMDAISLLKELHVLLQNGNLVIEQNSPYAAFIAVVAKQHQ